MRSVSRRFVLRGAGGAVIALPLLPELFRRAHAAELARPQRLVTFFFGNGMPPEYSSAGVDGPVLKSLAPVASKLAIVRGIDNATAARGVGHPHAKGSGSFAVGFSNPSEETAADRSLDVAAYEKWKRTTPVSSLAASLWWWAEDPVRSTHSWQGRGKPNPGVRQPLGLFQRLFGGAVPGMGAPSSPDAVAALRQRRHERSVLDAVVAGYKQVTGATSQFGAESKRLLTDHFDAVRSLERRAVAIESSATQRQAAGGACASPTPPRDVSPQQTCKIGCDSKGDRSGYDAGGGASGQSNWDEVWPLMADTFVMGLRCDITRFGNLTCTAAGDRYSMPGATTNVHDLAHGWRPGAENGFAQSTTWCMGSLAYLLKKLDDRTFLMPDGRTLLDHVVVMAGTEVGNPAPHSFSALTFFVAGGGGLFKNGVLSFTGKTEVDLYSTIAKAMGIADTFGDPTRFTGYLPGLV